jgi:hypothetical protein
LKKGDTRSCGCLAKDLSRIKKFSANPILIWNEESYVLEKIICSSSRKNIKIKCVKCCEEKIGRIERLNRFRNHQCKAGFT